MQYVYVLGDYEEYGTRNVVATLDREKLFGILRAWSFGLVTDLEKTEQQLHYQIEWHAEAEGSLRELLRQMDEELAKNDGGHNLHHGWGGARFYVIPLQ